MTLNNVLKINSRDNVAVALKSLQKGKEIIIEDELIILFENIPLKHKFALKKFNKSDPVYMYGVLVGSATQKINKGALLSIENIKHETNEVLGKTESTNWIKPDIKKWEDRTFMGYHRSDGQVGTENIWLFFPLVFCENRNIEILKNVFEKEFNPPKKEPLQKLLSDLIQPGKFNNEKNKKTHLSYKDIEVRFLTHQGGCGGTREDSNSLARLLSGYVNNPNVAGATILSLGCQNLQIDVFKDHLKNINSKFNKPLLIYEQQNEGTTNSFLSKVIKESFNAINAANKLKRSPAPLSKLNIGLECGGSDGFSGITSNPVLGEVSDILTALGGKSMLSEFPELCGVEQELVNRCSNNTNATKFLKLMKEYEDSAKKVGSGFDMNPSPGNIKDGLITDAMKSAGAAKKSGNSPINDILDYTEYVKKKGISLLCTPGNDVESTTALAASGANIILFTTGLGTPTGNPITPVIKVSSNSELALKMPDIIDFDCGVMISENKSLKKTAEELLEHIILIASGVLKAKAVVLEQYDFIHWKRGVSL
jgi:altronate hydrolase